MKTLITILMLVLASPCWAGGHHVNVTVGRTVAASNGEIGNNSGANDDTSTPSYPGNNEGLSSCFVTTTPGAISYIHARLSFSSGTPPSSGQYNVTINSAAGSLIRDGSLSYEPATVPGVLSIALDSPFILEAATTYCLGIGATGSPDNWSISSTIDLDKAVYTDVVEYTVGNTMPSTIDVSTLKIDNYSLRIWATNTADGT